jgi:hypothetical protein
MSESYVPTVMVNVSSNFGCTGVSPLVCRGTVTAGRSAAKSDDVRARRSRVGSMRGLRDHPARAFGGIWWVALLADRAQNRPMNTAALQISNLIPKLRPADRIAVRKLLDEADYKTWREDTTKFRQLMRGKVRDKRPASEVVSSLRR